MSDDTTSTAAGGRLAGKVAIITGAGQGIGLATALRFGEEGATVVAVGRTEASVKSAAEEIRAAGGRSSFQVADVSDDDQVVGMVEAVHREYGRIDILVNNAGGGNPSTTITSPAQDWKFVLDLNLGGTVSCSRAVWPIFQKAGSGVILNAGSQSGARAQLGLTAYCTSKAAIVMLTKCMALEGAPLGIRVNAVAPGWVLTPAVTTWFDAQDDPVTFHDTAAAGIPIGRLSDPREIANAYLFLASDESSYVNGAVLNVDGGSTLA